MSGVNIMDLLIMLMTALAVFYLVFGILSFVEINKFLDEFTLVRRDAL